MTQADPNRAERARAMEHEARALPDCEFEVRRVDAERSLAAGYEAGVWRDALGAKQDRRSVQRRAG